MYYNFKDLFNLTSDESILVKSISKEDYTKFEWSLINWKTQIQLLILYRRKQNVKETKN